MAARQGSLGALALSLLAAAAHHPNLGRGPRCPHQQRRTRRAGDQRVGDRGVDRLGPDRLAHTTDPYARLALDRLTYTGLPVGILSRDWLRLLREATPSYAAQPYQQLAAANRAAGHDGEVRRILIAQRQAQIDRGAADRADLGLRLSALAGTTDPGGGGHNRSGARAYPRRPRRRCPHRPTLGGQPLPGGGAGRGRPGRWPAVDQDRDPGPLDTCPAL